ncbi:MAG: transposase [Proteobacteria bacterium]|nr:transposase [Pseudomonadota bacterium]
MSKKPFKKSPIGFKQSLLFPANIFDLLPKDHESYIYSDIFKQIDTSLVEKKYQAIGQNAYHPQLITAILIYSYSRGVFSSRQIQRRCQEDLSFMYIAQMQCPNFRVLSNFRKDNLTFFEECFNQTVKIAIELKLAKLGHISLDGSKFKANTSKHKAMSYGRLKSQEIELEKEIAELINKANQCDQIEDQKYKETTGYEIPEDLKHKKQRLNKIKKAKQALELREQKNNPDTPIDDKKQISFTDTDASIMGSKGKGFDYNYNPQICTDKENQIIVAQHISQKANDKQELKPALEHLEETLSYVESNLELTAQDDDLETQQTLQNIKDKKPQSLSIDNGYMSGDNLQTIDDKNINTYIAINKGEKKNQQSLDQSERKVEKSDFHYNEKDDSFICPKKQKLTLVQENKNGRKIYQAQQASCQNCSYYHRCCKSKLGKPRSITTDAKEPLRIMMKQKMEQKTSKEIYSHRKTIVEPVFGQIKNSGFRGFSLRGLEKVQGEFSLVCATHNIKKIFKAITTGLIRPEFIKRGNKAMN